MMTAESRPTLSKRPVIRIVVALIFFRSQNYTSSFYGMSFLVEPPIYNRKGLKFFFCFYMIFSTLTVSGIVPQLHRRASQNRSTIRMTNRERGVVVKKIIFYNSHLCKVFGSILIKLRC